MEKSKKDTRKLENKIFHRETYQCPSEHSKMNTLKQTGNPITSQKTTSFDMAREIRTPYDKYWLKIYNSHSLNENYTLGKIKLTP